MFVVAMRCFLISELRDCAMQSESSNAGKLELNHKAARLKMASTRTEVNYVFVKHVKAAVSNTIVDTY